MYHLIQNKDNKALHIAVFLLSFLFVIPLFSQEKTGKKYEILWHNKDMTTVEDLGKVWIYRYRGDLIKNVSIWDINTGKGTVTYEKNGTLHDLQIVNIERIEAGSGSRSKIIFGINNIPEIVMAEHLYLSGITDFKVTKKYVHEFKPEVKAQEIKRVDETEKVPPVTEPAPEKEGFEPWVSSSVNDTLVKEDGTVLLIKLMEITATSIRYRRADLPNGPVYNVNKRPGTMIVRYKTCIKIVFKEQ